MALKLYHNLKTIDNLRQFHEEYVTAQSGVELSQQESTNY